MKLFNISAFLLSILLFTYTNSMSQDTSCAEYEQECTKTPPLPWLSSYKDVVLPQFPLCTVRVYYQHRECGNPPCHSTQWTITSIQYLDTNCNTIDLWLTNNGMGITSEKVRDLKIMLIQTITSINFEDWYNNAPEHIKAQVDCEGSCGHFKSVYFQKTCNKVCYATFDENGIVTHTLTEVPCLDYNECCGITYKYCKDKHGNTIVSHEVTGHFPNCYVSPYFDTTGCPENATDMQVIWCKDNCFNE